MLAKIVPTGGRRPACLAFGYSTRALVHALFSAGFRVISVDAFGDSDTRDFAEQTHILSGWGDYEALSSLTSILSDCYSWFDSSRGNSELLPVFLAGGSENWLDLMNFLARQPRLRILGPTPKQMKKIRSPLLWAESALHSGLKFPKTIFHHQKGDDIIDKPSFGSRWLCKPMLGSGGAAITPVEGEGLRPDLVSGSHYLQQEIAGRVIGATCVIEWSCRRRSLSQSSVQPQTVQLTLQSRPKSSLVGVTESWSSHDLPGPKEFMYRGSWGPIHLHAEQRLQIERAAEYLGRRSGVSGLLQMDLVEDSDGQLWLLEVNPRWSAGMEILLKSGLANPVIPHSVAWELSQISDWTMKTATGNSLKLVGKSVFYSPAQILLSESLVAELNALPRDQFADIPSSSAIGTTIASGAPLLSVLSEMEMCDSEAEARERLLQLISERSKAVLRLLLGRLSS